LPGSGRGLPTQTRREEVAARRGPSDASLLAAAWLLASGCERLARLTMEHRATANDGLQVLGWTSAKQILERDGKTWQQRRAKRVTLFT
jgi:hypothetical protein